MNGCCQRNAWGEEYPGQFEELGGPHDPECRLYEGPRNPPPAWAPLPPGFREAYDAAHPKEQMQRHGSNYTLSCTDGEIRFRFDHKPSEATLSLIRSFMRWNPREYVWFTPYTDESWTRALNIAETTVLPAKAQGFGRTSTRREIDDDCPWAYDDIFLYGD